MDRPKVEIEKPGKGFSHVTVTFTEDPRTTALNCAARLRRAASMAHGDPPQGVDPGVLDFEAGVLERLADRIEAAHARESGNAAAMREAMTSVAENLALHVQCGRFVAPGDHVSFPASEAEAYIRDIRAALSAPPRNCDVGNAADQARRFQDFCHAHRTASTSCMRTCPGYNAPDVRRCQAIWSQLPYQEGGKAE